MKNFNTNSFYIFVLIYRIPKLLEDLLPTVSDREFFSTELSSYVSQFLPNSDVEEEQENIAYDSLYKNAWRQVQKRDNRNYVTVFVLEKFMQRLGFIGQNKKPVVFSNGKTDLFTTYYSSYDLLFVIVFLYFGMCQESVISLPQIRQDRIAKKMKTIQDKEKLQELRNNAVSKLVSAEQIRSIWREIEPYNLRDYVAYGKQVLKSSSTDDGKAALVAFTKARRDYFSMFGSKDNTTQVKKEEVSMKRS